MSLFVPLALPFSPLTESPNVRRTGGRPNYAPVNILDGEHLVYKLRQETGV